MLQPCPLVDRWIVCFEVRVCLWKWEFAYGSGSLLAGAMRLPVLWLAGVCMSYQKGHWQWQIGDGGKNRVGRVRNAGSVGCVRTRDRTVLVISFDNVAVMHQYPMPLPSLLSQFFILSTWGDFWDCPPNKMQHRIHQNVLIFIICTMWNVYVYEITCMKFVQFVKCTCVAGVQ